MEGYMNGRSKEEVRGFTVEVLAKAAKGNTDAQEVRLAWSVQDSIQEGNMLRKEQAQYLHEVLKEHMHNHISELTMGGYADLDIYHMDELSIYSDAWALYCRPGTYTI